MEWIGIVAVVVGLLAAAWAWSRHSSSPVAPEDRIENEQLAAFLTESGIDLDSTRHPDPDILRPHIGADDELLGAVEARRGSKRAFLVVLPDRLVVGEATVGKMGAAVHSIPFDRVADVEQGYDVGGTFHIETDDEAFDFSHVPRSKTRDFAGLIRNRVGSFADAPV